MGYSDKCSVPRCRQSSVITYLGHELCEEHWNMVDEKSFRKKMGFPSFELTEDKVFEMTRKSLEYQDRNGLLKILNVLGITPKKKYHLRALQLMVIRTVLKWNKRMAF